MKDNKYDIPVCHICFSHLIAPPVCLVAAPLECLSLCVQISMPALKEHIYSSRSETAEAQHSIMHALFLLIRSKPSKCSENLQLALKIFNRLFDENFKVTMDVRNIRVLTRGVIFPIIVG